jgi:perosamine synthetase
MEQRFVTHYDNQFKSIGMCNATMALMSVLMALDLKAGDKILTTPFTWGGTIAGALFMKLNICFADIDKQTLTLSPDSVRDVLEEQRDIKLILDVDVFGNPSKADEIAAIAKQYKCFHLIDSASGFGSFYKGKPSGYYADSVVISFSESKLLNAGEGAVLLIRDSDLYGKVVFNTQHQYRAKRDIPDKHVNQFALNFRIHPVAAGVILSEFDRRIRLIDERGNKIANVLHKIEEELDLKILPAKDFKQVFSRTCIHVQKKDKSRLIQLIAQKYPELTVDNLSIPCLIPDDIIFSSMHDGNQTVKRSKLRNAYGVIRNAFEINFNSAF